MFANILWRFLILETFVLGALRNCSDEHPQKLFCSSELVLGVTYMGHMVGIPLLAADVLKVFKGDHLELHNWDKRYIIFVYGPEYNLTVGNNYYIFGHNQKGYLRFDMCDVVKPLQTTTPFYRRALVKFYKRGCDCIDEVPMSTAPKDCYWKYSFLVRRGENCTWAKTGYFRRCAKGLPISPPSE